MEQIAQGTPEWFRMRLGKATASRVADIVAKTKIGYSTSRANYMSQLLVERLTGNVAEAFTSQAMKRGTRHEDRARLAYEFRSDRDVQQTSFIDHPVVVGSGASPDGLVGTDGLIEIKCPTTSTHLDTLLEGRVPSKYEPQIQWQLACTGRSWCDFVSYDPRLPEHLSFFTTRVHREDSNISELENEVRQFVTELEELVTKVTAAVQRTA